MSACKSCVNAASPKWQQDNRERANAIQRRWVAANPEKRTETVRRFHKAHPERARDYRRKKCKEDLNFRISLALRSRVAEAFRLGESAGSKGGSAVRDLGCTIPELKVWLEAKFYPHPETGEAMTWDNRSLKGWHIDHRRPLKDFNLADRGQFLEACHYTNLQPLWSEQNWSKGARHQLTIANELH